MSSGLIGLIAIVSACLGVGYMAGRLRRPMRAAPGECAAWIELVAIGDGTYEWHLHGEDAAAREHGTRLMAFVAGVENAGRLEIERERCRRVH